MMKKLLVLLAVFSLSFAVKAQAPCTPTVITDTIHYYFNKYFFKSGNTNLSNYGFYKSTAMTSTNVSHLGCKFENIDTIEVFGLEAIASKNGKSSTEIFPIPMRIYLCSMDAATGKPKLPAIDSVQINVTNPFPGTQPLPQVWGANFTKSHKIVGNYAVCVRNVSTVAGDTLRIYRTACKTPTAWPNATWQEKYSDGYGFVRYAGTFQSTTNFTNYAGFGVQSDYEWFVAPRVSYSLTACELWPQSVIDGDDICTHAPITFTNASSWRYTHRMYNLHEFYRKWNTQLAPIVTAPATGGGWPVDSAITWQFDNEDNGVGGKIYLPYGGGANNTITYQTDSVLSPKCSNQNFFRANFRGMNIFGTGYERTFQEMINICIVYCNGDALGLSNIKGFESVNIFPNPAKQGRTTISGLNGKTRISVYNMTGQLISQEAVETDRTTVDLTGKPDGVYTIRMVNDANKSAAVRLIKGAE
jgi:hypothetical protein